MKQIVRHGTFETNSSSTHSISIDNREYKPANFTLNDEGFIDIECGEFGWEECTYHGAEIKLSYALTSIFQNVEHEEEGLKSAHYQMLHTVMEEMVEGFKGFKFEESSRYYKYGYIDHQSSDVIYEAFSSKDNLKDFIFNPNSILVTDNDNH